MSRYLITDKSRNKEWVKLHEGRAVAVANSDGQLVSDSTSTFPGTLEYCQERCDALPLCNSFAYDSTHCTLHSYDASRLDDPTAYTSRGAFNIYLKPPPPETTKQTLFTTRNIAIAALACFCLLILVFKIFF